MQPSQISNSVQKQPPMNHFNLFYRISLALTVMVGCWVSATPVFAQFHEDFEKLGSTWQRSQTDCVIQKSKWSSQRVNEDSKNNRFEQLNFTTGHGTHIFVTHDVTPALVISELKPSVRVRSGSRGAKIYVRIVLPETPAPDGSGPMTTLISGDAYKLNGKWQRLTFGGNGSNSDLAASLRDKVLLLRREYGDVSATGAYVDKVVLNVYSGAGETSIDIDDLKVDGIVVAKPVLTKPAKVVRDDKVRSAAAYEPQADKKRSLVVRDGTVLLVKKQPFFASIIQHNGEPFKYLKALGFNVIELKRTATYEQLESASELDLWLVCPPPSNVGLSKIPFHFDRVMAWNLGEDLTGRDLPVLEQRIQEIRESDQRVGRPIIGHAVADWTALTNLTDILVAGLQPLGTSALASQYSDWIQVRSDKTGNRRPIWADVQTELSPALKRQIKVLVSQTPPTPIEPQQMKFLAYEAISGGARGIRFTSANRLDGVDPVTRLRALTLEWINAELAQLEPWIAGGALLGKLSLPVNSDVEVTAINTSRSRLLLIQRPTHHEQYLAGDQPLKQIKFQDLDSAFSDKAYLINKSGLESLANVRGINGTQIVIDNCPYTAAVVLTQDPLVVNFLTASYERFAQQSILKMQFELTKQWLAIEQLVNAQMQNIGRQTPAAGAELERASVALAQATQMLNQQNKPQAELFLNQANEHLAQTRREVINEPLASFQSKSSAALTSHCSLIPLHWTLADLLASGNWNPNGLPGGDFENLTHMQSNGWQNRRIESQTVATKVELTESAATDGKYGLKMSVASRSGRTVDLVESPPLTIQTPSVKVRAGELVRIHGWVNVPSPFVGSQDGLRITDTLGGPAMAERVPITSGWKEFTLYRGVEKTGEVSVSFEMTGIGVANIDEVTIRTIPLPAEGLRQAKRP